MSELKRGSSGYDEARELAVWNQLRPERFPDLIVQVETEDDVIRAVKDAKAAGRKVTVRSGGHSWSGHHLRDGTTLVDLSKMNSVISVDADAMTAVAEPGCYGTAVCAALDEHGLFFPIGHCKGVGIGGYLLQGGYGWNGRALGPACSSIEAIDVVTADGELVRASETENPDLFWAARGSGPGFFGVVVRFHLKVYPKSDTVANGVFVYPIELLDEVFTWLHQIGPKVGIEMELMALIHNGFEGDKEIIVSGPVFADSEDRAREVMSILETCPVLDQAKGAFPYGPITVADLTEAVYSTYPDNHRYCVDNIWTHAPAEDLIPGIKRIAETLPDGLSHMLWMNWAPSHPATPDRPEMAYSVEDETYIALYGISPDSDSDAGNIEWATERMREMEHLSTGIQLADENLERRTGRFLSDQNYTRYDQIRAEYDPEQLFHSWGARP